MQVPMLMLMLGSEAMLEAMVVLCMVLCEIGPYKLQLRLRLQLRKWTDHQVLFRAAGQ